MTDCHKSSFFLSKKGIHAILRTNLMRKNDKHNIRSREKAQNLINCAVFRDKFSNNKKMNPVTPLVFSHHKSSGVMFYIWSDFVQNNISIGF